MSARAQQAVWASRLKPHLKLTAVCIAWHCNDESGLAWMSKGTLARECGATERNVTRNVQELLAMGVLKQSRRGGGRITSQYEFDFGALAAVGAATPDAGVRGEADAATLARTGTPGNPPLTPASGHPRRGRPLPLTPASGERDERASPLSSKAAPVSAKPDTHAAARAAAPERPSNVTTMPRPMKTKQPPSGNQVKAAEYVDPLRWVANDDTLSQRGVALGMPTLAEATATGSRNDYVREALSRNNAAKGKPTAKAKRA